MGSNQRKRRSGSFIGVDISASCVKLLELDGKPSAMRVASYASEPLPANAISDNQIINVDAVGQAVARALKKSRSRNTHAAISVSSAAVISKTLTMPAEMNDGEIESQIMLESPQHIPYPIENVSLDFQVLGPDPDNETRNRVLLVACRRDNVEMRTAVLDVAKLRPRLVDVEEYALCNACTLLYDQMANKGHDNTVAIFEMGAQQTRLNVLQDRRAIYSREVAFGGQVLADELISQYELDDVNQLNAQLRDGQLKGLDIALLLDGFCDLAASQIESTLQFYFSTEAESEHIDQILLTGGCTLYPGFEEQMQNRLSWPALCADPLRDIKSSGNARRNHVEHDGPTLMIAAGLSMRAVEHRSAK